MRSYIFAAAAVVGAVANAAMIRREAHAQEQLECYGQAHPAVVDPTPGQDTIELPCGATTNTTYVVGSGETLSSISSTTGAGICDIAAASGITNVNLIFADQILTIPLDCTSIDNTTCITPPVEPTETCVAGLPSAYIVQSGNTLTSISQDFLITLDALIAANPQIADVDVIEVGQVINVPVCPNSQCGTVGTYEIASGDLFVDLATQYGSTVGQIKALNPMVVPENIQVGQQIILPQNCVKL